MTDLNPQGGHLEHRSLRDWLAGFFRAPLSNSSADPPPERVPETLEPNDRTRLLKLDDGQGGPAYGTRDGLSTPQVDGGPEGHIRNGNGNPTFVQGSENLPPRTGSGLAWPVKNHKTMYLSYYIPFFNWITQYRWSFLRGDLIAALTIASIYIPMALSLASNLAHAPAINGLYSFVFMPLLYAILGSSPLLVVGPEAAGSLLTGTIVKASVKQGHSQEDDEAASAMVVGIATAMAGAMILVAGLTRLGFLDNVLSRPFLRGFITAIGFVIFVDQLIPEVGLADLAKEAGVSHGSTVQKLVFFAQNIKNCHGLTAAVSFGSFAIIMLFRTIKKALEPRYPQVVYFPDRILVVILSAILTWRLGWYEQGLEVLGSVQNTATGLFAFRWPFQLKHLKHVRTAMSTSFIIAILGFFESSVAAKGLGERRDGVQGMSVSANREMVALGVANVVGGCFMALPAFGGYGRSKVNASTGARSPMSSIFLSVITFIVIMVLLPYLYYLPKAVLCSTISVVAYSLIEECPHDVAFFIRLRGWTELALMLLIFVSTIFYSLELGIALGIGLSILILIRHSTQPRIQILGKIAGTSDQYDNAEMHSENVELIDGALVVKIPEPLTFANTGDLKNRLRRLEFYGSNRAHPSLPRLRPPESNKNVIFDVHGVTSIDGSGTQVLSEIVNDYINLGVSVYFCRLSNRSVFRMFERSGIVDRCGGMSHFVPGVDEALRLAESEGRASEP
ncbi:hypothetical protein AtubIFM57258_009221 [Aspergillus tubingensis]|nr:hypothetical protein AtubIFM57258_009221 [Aspergillus tubingensis]